MRTGDDEQHSTLAGESDRASNPGGYQRCRIHPRHPSAVILPRYPRYSVVILLPRHPPHTVVISAQAEIQCPYPLSLTV